MTVDLSIVVAVYNEDPRNLVTMLERLWKVISPLGMSYEVVFVNDGSREHTSNALVQLAKQVDHVKLVVLSRNFGQQAAISAGMDYAEGDAVVNLDSDLQDPPELIPDMVQRWKQGYDVVYAQRLARRDRIMKRLSAFLFYRVLGALSSVSIPWDTGDFRLLDRKVVDALRRMPEKTRFLRGQIPWLGFKQTGIPIDRGARELGESTYTLRKLFTLALDGLLGFSSSPLYLISTVGALLLAASALALLLWLGVKWQSGQFAFDNIALLLAVGAFTGVQILCLGCMAAYLSKVLDEVRARPTYVVAETLGLAFARASKRESSDRTELDADDAQDFQVPAAEGQSIDSGALPGYPQMPSSVIHSHSVKGNPPRN
jgi:dolichol-phosphate mannosyltransferase